MSRIPVAAAAAALAALAALESPSALRADGAPLLVRTARVVERPVGGVLTPSTVVVRGAFAPSGSYAALHRDSDELALDVGGAEIVRTDRAADGARLRFRRHGWAWAYSARSSGAPRSSSALSVDFLRGSFRARCSGAAVADLMADGAEGVPVTLRLGDAEISATIDLTHRGRAWRYKAPARGVPRDPPTGGTGDGSGDGTGGGGSGGSGGTQPPTGTLSFRSLGGDFAGGATTGGVTVVRTSSAFSSQWAGRTSLPLPQVDFSREMVVFVDLGVRSTGGYSVLATGARGVSGAIVVDYTETQPGTNCVVTESITQVWTAVAVPASSASVSGNRTVVVQNCP